MSRPLLSLHAVDTRYLMTSGEPLLYTLRPISSANGRTCKSPTADTDALPSRRLFAICKGPISKQVLTNSYRVVTYLLKLICRDRLQALADFADLERLTSMNKTR